MAGGVAGLFAFVGVDGVGVGAAVGVAGAAGAGGAGSAGGAFFLCEPPKR